MRILRYAFIALALAAFPGCGRAADADDVHLTLKNGSVVRGEILSENEHTLKLRTRLGDLTVSKSEVKEDSLDRLKRKGESREDLLARIADLEKRVEALEKENSQLKAANNGKDGPRRDHPIQNGTKTEAKAEASPAEKSGNSEGERWLSPSGKRHNNKCRFFGSKSGRVSTAAEGEPCKSCGG